MDGIRGTYSGLKQGIYFHHSAPLVTLLLRYVAAEGEPRLDAIELVLALQLCVEVKDGRQALVCCVV